MLPAIHNGLVWLESTGLSVWVRESVSVFAFPSVLALHTIGMGLVAGLSAAIDLRILGFAGRVPLMELRRFFPVLWFGFWLNAISGVVLLIGYPTKAVTNPLFYFKLLFIAIAIVLLRKIQERVFSEPKFDLDPIPGHGRRLAMVSLACWAAAIASGRLLAYTYTKLTSI